jgi:hypothetical protein
MEEVISLVGHIIQAIADQHKRFNELQDAQHDFILQFKHVSGNMTQDLTRYKTIFETCIHHGNKTTLSNLLRSENGKKAYEGLEASLQAMGEILESMTRSVATLASRSLETRISVGRVVAPLLLGNSIEDANKSVRNSTEKLKECGQSTARAFRLFHDLYLHYTKSPPNSLPEMQQDTSEYLSLDAIICSFNSCPFGLGSTGQNAIDADQLFCLNKNWKVAEAHNKCMMDVGKAWVKDQLAESEESVHTLWALQTRLTELLWRYCTERLKDQPVHSKTSDPGDDFQVLEDSLKDAVNRANASKVSIAFCGMVKSGCINWLLVLDACLR